MIYSSRRDRLVCICDYINNLWRLILITGGNQSCLSRGCGDSRTRGGVRARDGSPRTILYFSRCIGLCLQVW